MMNDPDFIPRILIIDDVFGRTHADCRNEDRSSLCGKYLFEDVTGDELGKGTPQRIKKPLARVVFCRGQTPKSSTIGDTVENDIEETLRVVREGWIEWPRWSMVLLDLCFYTGKVTKESNNRQKGMPVGRDGDSDPETYFGLELLEVIHDEFPELPIIILSSKPKDELVVQTYNSKGALGFLARDSQESLERLRDFIDRHGLISDQTGKIIGHSIPLLLALRSARAVAKTDGTVLLRGATGSGKGLFAEYIHENSQRKGNPFVATSLTAIPDTLAETELFGSEPGGFTGSKTREGYFEQANGGTLLLDEIGDATPAIQGKLLRAIQDKEIQKVGAKTIKRVDVRLISATKADIEKRAMTAGGFRDDLYYRIKRAGVIFLPDLKDRIEDIPLLIETFLKRAQKENQSLIEHRIAPDAMNIFCGHSWPGNVRELETVIKEAVIHHSNNEILYPHHFQIQVQEASGTKPTVAETFRDGEGLQSRAVASSQIDSTDDLIHTLTTFDFERLTAKELAARFPDIEAAYAILVANELKSACIRTKRYSADWPEGEIKLTPAIKMILGKNSKGKHITATMAKRMVINFSKISDANEVQKYWATDPILKTLLEKARAKKNSGDPK